MTSVTGDRAMMAVLGVLATWRVSHFIANEDGPADIMTRWRARLPAGELGRLVGCFQCVSVWVAMPVVTIALRQRRDRIVTWLAMSGAACLLERLTTTHDGVAEIFYDTTEGEDR